VGKSYLASLKVRAQVAHLLEKFVWSNRG
jgi:hypothetical protein